MQRNVSGQKILLFAFDYSTNAPKTGDAANLTAYVSKDGGAVTVLTDTTATEMDATNAKGWYSFDVTQTESNADELVFTGKSSTANVSVVGRAITTTPASFTSFVTPTGASVNATQFAGQTITAAAGVTLPSSVASPTNITAATGVVLSAAGVQAIWDALTAALTTANSIGKRLVDNLTGDIYARLGAPAGASVSADVAAVKADTASIYAAVDTEVAAILAAVDTEVSAIQTAVTGNRAEPGQGNPPATTDAMTKLDYVYKLARNKVTQDATTLKVYGDDGLTVDHKSTVSDDGTTFTRGELATGP